MNLSELEGTARYACLLLAPGLRPSAEAFFCPLGKKYTFNAVCAYFRHFWCSVVTSVMFSSNLSKFEKNPNNPKKSKKFQNN